jgi:hypothetical protein
MREPDERIGAGVGPEDERSALRILGHLVAWIDSVLSRAEPTSGGCAAAIHYYGGCSRPSAGGARPPAPIGHGREQATR